MVSNELTIDKLERSVANLDTLDLQVGGDENATWVAPSGETGLSYLAYIKRLFENGGLPATPYSTYEKMVTEGADLAEGSIAVVMNDSDASKNGFYQKQGGDWYYQKYNLNSVVNNLLTEFLNLTNDTSALIKLPIDSDWALALEAADGQTFGIKNDGEIVTPKPLPSISSAALSSYDDRAVLKIADADGKVIFASDKNGHPISLGDTKSETSYKTIFKKHSVKQMSIYQKGSGDNFIEYNFERETREYDGGSTAFGNLDCWRIIGAFECNAGLNRIRQIVNDGAWELAIRERGTDDAIGTYHGDEVLTDAFFIIDNKKYDQDSIFDFYDLNSFEFVQTSKLYRCNTQIQVATVYRHHVWSNNQLIVEQYITFTESIVVQDAWLAMLPSLRKSNITTGEQLTDRGVRLYNGQIYNDINLSDAEFERVMTPMAAGDEAKLWGSSSGLSYSLKMLATPNLPNQNFHFSNAAVYNKFYFNAKGFRSEDYVTTKNEVWHSAARYQLNTSN